MKNKIESIRLNKVNDSFYTQIVNYWRKMISTGALKDGDALPSERELAEMFGVSRVPVREALKVLEYLGFVQQIRGKGVFVKKADPESLFGTLGPMLTATSEMLEDLFDARLLLEPYAAKCAATQATDEQLARMQQYIDNMEYGIRNKERVEETSFSFHTEVIKASGNQVLLMITYFISELQKQSRNQTLWDTQHRNDAFDYHREIFYKIKEGDGDAAYKLMYEHLVHAKEFMLEHRNVDDDCL